MILKSPRGTCNLPSACYFLFIHVMPCTFVLLRSELLCTKSKFLASLSFRYHKIESSNFKYDKFANVSEAT